MSRTTFQTVLPIKISTHAVPAICIISAYESKPIPCVARYDPNASGFGAVIAAPAPTAPVAASTLFTATPDYRSCDVPNRDYELYSDQNQIPPAL